MRRTREAPRAQGGRELPFTEGHPPVEHADGAVPQPRHDQGAVGVTGQAGDTAVSSRGNVLPREHTDTTAWLRGTLLRALNQGPPPPPHRHPHTEQAEAAPVPEPHQ